jgi:hypothetical protein
MLAKVADAVAETMAAWSQSHPVPVLWHGVKPLATGLVHFAMLIRSFGPAGGHPVRHGMQTNATLIDARWCELFATIPVAVAVSIDGPAPENTAEVTEFWAALAQCWTTDRRMPIPEFAHAFGYVRDALSGRSAARTDRPVNPISMITWDGQVVPVSPDLAGFSSPRLGLFTVDNVADAQLDELLARAAEVPRGA